MRGSWIGLLLALSVVAVPVEARAEAAGGVLASAATPVCAPPDPDPTLREEERKAWSPCERWVWSCLRQGQEANLFARECVKPRGEAMAKLRASFQWAPFVDPDRFKSGNALGDEFLRTILSDRHYTSQIPPHGIRIFGAYFAEQVNLENLSTAKNLVLDGSIFKQGIRLTNFRGEKNLSFDGSNVRSSILMMRARIDGSLFLGRGVYDDLDVRDARIGASIDADRSVFNGTFRLDRAHVDGKVNLVKSRLTVLNAWDATIGGSLELRLADIRVRMDMTGSTINGDVRLQRMRFGRERPGGMPSCDWDPSVHGDHVLSEAVDQHRGERDVVRKLLDEMVWTRPSPKTQKKEDVCEPKKGDIANEVLLRDMRIKGTLCLIDLSGEIAPPSAGAILTVASVAPPRRRQIETVSLDGTQAHSTVLRWMEAETSTLWRAVNFKTEYMLINLQAQPSRHYMDNLNVGFLAFVRRPLDGQEPEVGDENVDKYLCDVTPARDNVMRSDARETHERIVRFFSGPANQSGSAQPFAKVVERLEQSGVASSYLKAKLSEYRYAKMCRNAAFTKAYAEQNPWLPAWQKAQGAWVAIWGRGEERAEIRNWREAGGDAARVVFDGICRAGMAAYKHTVSYGHEPYYLVVYVIGCIALFWGLLLFDRRPAGPASSAAPKLGLFYAIDTFVPLAQFRTNRRHANLEPNSRLLRAYLRLHRFFGLVLSVLVFLLLYRAAT